MSNLFRALKKANIPGHLCNLALGHDHHPVVRYLSGGVIMLSGVVLAKVGGSVHTYHFHIFADLLGYAIHGLGAVPFIEWLIEAVNRGEAQIDLAFPEITIEDSEEGGYD